MKAIKPIAAFVQKEVRNKEKVTGGAGYHPKHPGPNDGPNSGNNHPRHPGYDKDRK
jgi:hypothetical protein